MRAKIHSCDLSHASEKSHGLDKDARRSWSETRDEQGDEATVACVRQLLDRGGRRSFDRPARVIPLVKREKNRAQQKTKKMRGGEDGQDDL
jgi:hypothetical protein